MDGRTKRGSVGRVATRFILAQVAVMKTARGPLRFYQTMPWEMTLQEFSNPYPKPRSGYVSLFHYTQGSANLEAIGRTGLRAPFAHQDPEFTSMNQKPLVHFQAPSAEVRAIAQGGTVVPLTRDVSPEDILSLHDRWPVHPTHMLLGKKRVGFRSDIGGTSKAADVGDIHRAYVEAAILTGERVPDRVLGDYPKLKQAPDDPDSYGRMARWFVEKRQSARVAGTSGYEPWRSDAAHDREGDALSNLDKEPAYAQLRHDFGELDGGGGDGYSRLQQGWSWIGSVYLVSDALMGVPLDIAQTALQFMDEMEGDPSYEKFLNEWREPGQFVEALALYRQDVTRSIEHPHLGLAGLIQTDINILRREPKSASCPPDWVMALRVAAKFQKKKEVPKAKGTGTTTVYEYSEGQIQHRNREKAKKVEKLRGSLDRLRSAVKKDLKSGDEKKRLSALAVGLMNDTYERVGNEGSAKDGHFGVTGWQAKHVSFSGGSATISYIGKSGVKQTKTTTDAGLVSGLKAALKGKSGTDPVFDGVDAGAVNVYLKPHGITAKDIRGLHANREVQTRLKAIRGKGGKLPTDKKERETKLKKEFEQAVAEAAEAVGHEASTLRSQYLVPGIEDNFLRDGTVKENLAKQGSARRALKQLKSNIMRLNRLYVAEDYEALGGVMESARERRLFAKLIGDADEYLTGKRRPLDARYEGDAQELLENSNPVVHLADGGYSRLTLSMRDSPFMWLDKGTATAGVLRMWRQGARPIRLPTREIKALAKKLTQRLRSWGLPKPGRVVAQEYLPLTNVLGNAVVVEILLTGSPRRHPDPFNNELLHGGFLKRRSGDGPLMRVFINPYLRSFEQRPAQMIEGELYRILAHELTHAADIWSGKGSVGDLSGSREDLKRHHHNHPAEVRALMRDVVAHVEDAVREFMDVGMDFNMATREALKDSKWPDIEPYLTQKNKKIILKGVHTHLRDRAKQAKQASNPLKQMECEFDGAYHLIDVSKDRFIHFTPRSRAAQILKDGKLLMRPPYKKMGIDAVNAVSLVWGQFVPGVQTSHTKLDPGDDLVGIVFQTTTTPDYGFVEEVVWKRDVALRNPKVVSFSQGKGLLSRAPVQIGDGDQVRYKMPSWCSGFKAKQASSPEILVRENGRDLTIRIMGEVVTDEGWMTSTSWGEVGGVNIEFLPLAKAKVCQADVAAMHKAVPLKGLYMVSGAFLPENMRGQGIGKMLYERALQEAAKRGCALIPEHCWHKGMTTPDAKRVWASLKRRFFSVGDVVWGGSR